MTKSGQKYPKNWILELFCRIVTLAFAEIDVK